MSMTQEELAVIIAGVTANLKTQATTADATQATTADATLPGWMKDAQTAQTTTTKKSKAAAKPDTVKPHHVAEPASFKGSKGAVIKGIRVVKMFGAEPDRRRPQGKFLTYSEVKALVKVAHLVPDGE